MIAIKSDSNQVLSKDDFILKGDYFRSIKLFGIQLWKINSKVDNKISDKNFKISNEKNVGFGKK